MKIRFLQPKILISVISATLLACLLSAYFYVKDLRFYEPVCFSFRGLTTQEQKQIQIFGTTPLYRTIFTLPNDSLMGWPHFGGYYNSIGIVIPDKIINKIQCIEITLSDTSYNFRVDDLLISTQQYTKTTYLLPVSAKSKFSFSKIYLTLKNNHEFTLAFSFAAAIGIILIFSFAILRKKSLRNKIATYWKSSPITRVSVYFTMNFVIVCAGFCFFGGRISMFLSFLIAAAMYLTCWQAFRLIILIVSGKLQNEKKRNIMLINTSIFATLFALEIGIRLTGYGFSYSETRSGIYQSPYDASYSSIFINGYTGEKTLTSPEYCFSRHSNSEGFSDNEWDLAKPDSAIRILALGDSFTEGDGAHADSTWVKFLERKINNNHYNYMNAGVFGSDPVFSYNIFKFRLLKYKPDIVLLCITASDIQDILFRGGFERFTQLGVTFTKAPIWEFFYGCSHVSRLVFNLFYTKELINKNRYTAESQKAMAILTDCILKYQRLCNQHSIEFTCILHPSDFSDAVVAFCKSNSVRFVDLRGFYNEKQDLSPENYSKYYWQTDGHHTALGYQLMADGIYEGMVKNQSIICKY
ncbi:MAG: SGNH/GDSL hydrolase family protein [Saprospiraceae bacterium]|nr:SGNH/GDSL hydrolase family protein [Saprospiraceae bacterium]